MALTDKDPADPLEESIEPTEQQAEQELEISRRFVDWKTLASFAFAVAVLIFVIATGHINLGDLLRRVRAANKGLFLAAFAVYYLTFPLRGLRWKVLLENAYRETHSDAVDQMTVRGLSEIIFISWFVNCVVPAKLGDLYRAYLAKLWVHISFTKTIGTVVAERIVDILVLGFLMAATGFIVFHNKLGGVSTILFLGMGLAIVGVLALIAMKTMSHRIRRLIPARFRERYIAFEEGALQSLRRLPLLLSITILIWFLEGSRLQLVVLSLGLQGTISHISTIPLAPMLFFALATAVLTTVPFTPGGLGLVEAGLYGMMLYLGVPKLDAAAIVLVDRLLSYYSVAFLGFLVYLVSKRSHHRHPS